MRVQSRVTEKRMGANLDEDCPLRGQPCPYRIVDDVDARRRCALCAAERLGFSDLFLCDACTGGVQKSLKGLSVQLGEDCPLCGQPRPFYENGRAVQRALRTMRQASMRAQGT